MMYLNYLKSEGKLESKMVSPLLFIPMNKTILFLMFMLNTENMKFQLQSNQVRY